MVIPTTLAGDIKEIQILQRQIVILCLMQRLSLYFSKKITFVFREVLCSFCPVGPLYREAMNRLDWELVALKILSFCPACTWAHSLQVDRGQANKMPWSAMLSFRQLPLHRLAAPG